MRRWVKGIIILVSTSIALTITACGAKTVEDAVANADKVIEDLNSKNYNSYEYDSTYLDDEGIYGVHMKTDMCSSSDDFEKMFIYDSTVSGATIPELTDDQSKYVKSIYDSFKKFEDTKVVFVVLYNDDMIKAAVVDGKEVYYSETDDAVMRSDGVNDFINFCEGY